MGIRVQLEQFQKNPAFKKVWRVLVICAAAALMATNINTFVHAGGLYPGGATGLTVLIQRAAELYLHVSLPYTVINVIINAVPVYIGFRFIGKRFTLYSLMMIMLTNVLTDLLPGFEITSDTLLVAVFGGLVNGLAISLCLSVNATTGGTDFLSIYLSEKHGMDSWNIILGINAVILGMAGLLFGWDKALYSIIFQFVSTQVLHTLYKRYQQVTLLIVTHNAQEICDGIYKVCHHGATILDGEGSHEHNHRNIVYSVVSSSDLASVLNVIHEIDPKAFTNTLKTAQLSGHFYYRPQD